MCYEVLIGDKMIESVRNLETVMQNGVVLDEEYNWLKPNQDSCLCALDLMATAARNGFRVKETGSMSLEFIKTNNGPKI